MVPYTGSKIEMLHLKVQNRTEMAAAVQVFNFSSWRDQPQVRLSCCSRTVSAADCS
jgi:hypothetical protein